MQLEIETYGDLLLGVPLKIDGSDLDTNDQGGFPVSIGWSVYNLVINGGNTSFSPDPSGYLYTDGNGNLYWSYTEQDTSFVNAGKYRIGLAALGDGYIMSPCDIQIGIDPQVYQPLLVDGGDDNPDTGLYVFTNLEDNYPCWTQLNGQTATIFYQEGTGWIIDGTKYYYSTSTALSALVGTYKTADGSVSVVVSPVPTGNDLTPLLNPSGTGSTATTITVQLSGVALPGVLVTVWVDQAMTSQVGGPQTTNGLGQVTFNLNSGTYWISRTLSGITFSSNPYEISI